MGLRVLAFDKTFEICRAAHIMSVHKYSAANLVSVDISLCGNSVGFIEEGASNRIAALTAFPSSVQ